MKVHRILGGFFSADQYKIEWNKSWKAGFKAGDFYEK